MSYETQFLIALLTTLIVEVPLAVLLVFLFKEKKIRVCRTIGIGMLATLLTIPYLRFIFAAFFDYRTMAIGGEILIFVVEALLYWKLLPIKFWKAAVISLIANVASMIVGILL
jgi:hypothetical protein